MEDVKLTKEQSDIVDFIDVLLSDNSKYKAIGIKAFAGCGKSFVLKYIATKLKNKKILGLAFNNSIVKENAHSFPKRNSKWFTVHTLAKEYLIKNGVEFDFKNSGFIDSSGIGVILGRYRQVQAMGGTVKVSNMSASVRKIIHMAGLHQLIEEI